MRLEGRRRRSRGLSLAPLVDVVFLLLVFFLLASRFEDDRVLDLVVGGAAAEAAGPPPTLALRLRDRGNPLLDGRAVAPSTLAAALEARLAGPDPPALFLRAEPEVPLSRIHAVLEIAAGLPGVRVTLSGAP